MTGFGNPKWAATHSAASSTAPAVLSLLKAGATCVGRTVMDEMAYRFRFSSSVIFIFGVNLVLNLIVIGWIVVNFVWFRRNL